MKLFRKLRHTLIKDGKLKRYVFYAIGEILLVMIGILLAFQVNNWNDDRIKKKAEIQSYKNLRDQLVDDRDLIQGQINYNNRHYAEYKYANEIIETDDRGKLDTLGAIVIRLTNYSDFDRKGNIYETMVNSGEVQLLQNHEIIDGVRQLEEKYTYINRIESIHYDAMIRYVAPTVNRTTAWSTEKIQKPEVIYSFEFQNLIETLMHIMEEKDQVYLSTLDEIARVTQLINEELEAN